MGGSWFKANLGQKFMRFHLSQWLGTSSLATWGSRNKRTMVQARMGIKQGPVSKITKAKRAGREYA
jgi:hypothetical protein